MPFAHISCLFHRILCVSAHSFQVLCLTHSPTLWLFVSRLIAYREKAMTQLLSTECYKWMRMWIVTHRFGVLAWETAEKKNRHFLVPLARFERSLGVRQSLGNDLLKKVVLQFKQQSKKSGSPITSRHKFRFLDFNTSLPIVHTFEHAIFLSLFCRMEGNACVCKIQMSMALPEWT